MKTAILISGELRTFSICRPTMTFLDDPNADIYVSTWSESIVKNDRLNLDKVDLVSEESISTILNRSATIMVEPLSCIDEKKYNSKMIHRWLAGMQMILDSNQEYDYVLVTRPDLFFNHTHPSMFTIDSLIADGDKQFAWYEEGHKLQDNLFFTKFSTMKELFARLSVQVWEEAKEGDWHTWWTDFVGWTEVKRLGGHVPFTFCRPIVKEGMDFSQVYLAEQDWRDLRIVHLISLGDRAGMVNAWGEEQVKRAEAKATNGSFEHYKTLAGEKVCVVISGLLRNYEASALSLHIWGEHDRYMCTWSSSGNNNISDYEKIANIKQTFIIDDNEFESIYRDPYNYNPFRMVYLWKKMVESIPKTYDKYVIIRPDAFYWTERPDLIQQLILENNFCVNQTENSITSGLNDHVFIVSRDNLNLISAAHELMLTTAAKFTKKGIDRCVHKMLWDMWKHIPNICSAELDCLVDTLFVRDTFKLRTKKNYDWPVVEDEYNYNLYRAIFYDTAARWRRWSGGDYEGSLRPPRNQ